MISHQLVWFEFYVNKNPQCELLLMSVVSLSSCLRRFARVFRKLSRQPKWNCNNVYLHLLKLLPVTSEYICFALSTWWAGRYSSASRMVPQVQYRWWILMYFMLYLCLKITHTPYLRIGYIDDLYFLMWKDEYARFEKHSEEEKQRLNQEVLHLRVSNSELLWSYI